MKRRLFYLLTILTFVSCQSENSNSNDSYSNTESDRYEEPVVQLTEEELQEQLERTECSSPNQYLDGSVSYKPIYKNVLSLKVKGLKMTFDLSSNATLATFKDVDITLELLSKTGSVIKRDNLTIYEYIKPYGSTQHKYEMSITNQQFNDLYNVSWSINGADCFN